MKYRIKKTLFNNNEATYTPQFKYKFIPIWFNYKEFNYVDGPGSTVRFYTEKKALDFINKEIGLKIKEVTYLTIN